MASLIERYLAGEHEQVWREIDVEYIPLAEIYDQNYGWRVSVNDIDAVMHETFTRVARNVDLLIKRLRELGYQFECELPEYGEAAPPRRPCSSEVFETIDTLRARYKEMSAFQHGSDPFPRAIVRFSEIVGSVDLRQAWNGDDRIDPILSALGDFDPLVVDPEYFANDAEEDRDIWPTPIGGMGLIAEFAPSFEHKANVSGAENPHFFLPTDRHDPIVMAENIQLTFTGYLRKMFARGGFYGVSRKTRSSDLPLREVETGMYLLDHPAIAELATEMELF